MSEMNAFLTELADLLEKHKADIDISCPYAECCEVTFSTETEEITPEQFLFSFNARKIRSFIHPTKT